MTGKKHGFRKVSFTPEELLERQRKRSKLACHPASNKLPENRSQGREVLESDTSGWDCVHMSAVERFKHAASLQVMYEDMEIYKDDIKTYKDWMVILDRLEMMQGFDPSMFHLCITERWIKIGKPIVKTMSDEEVYRVIEKLAALQQNLLKNQQQNQNYRRSYSQQNQNQQLIYGNFPRDLLEKLGLDDFISWSNVFDRLTKIKQVDQNFLKQLALEHFLPLAEKFVEGGYLSQIHQLLLKISGLKLSISEVNVQSFVRRICRQQVLRYEPQTAVPVQMYIDMLCIVGEMMPDSSLQEIKESQKNQYSYGYNNYFDQETQQDIIPFFKICYSVILLNQKDITSLEQIKQIQKVRRKFNQNYGIPSEVTKWDTQVLVLKIPQVSQQEIQNAINQYRY